VDDRADPSADSAADAGAGPSRAALEVAESLDAPVELLPHLPELLADLRALGCVPGAVVGLLRGVLAPAGAPRVLDVPCGKGAVALALAEELGARVTGVDLFEPFVADARVEARRRGLAERCAFERADLRDALDGTRAFDAVVYASSDVLGRHDDAVGALRRAARPGGYLVIDDGHLGERDATDSAGFGHYASGAEVRRRLTAHGDRIVAEAAVPPAEDAARNRDMTAAIRLRAAALEAARPELGPALRAFVARQEEECAALARDWVSVTWLLQRGGDRGPTR